MYHQEPPKTTDTSMTEPPPKLTHSSFPISPHFSLSTAHRRVAIAVDLSDESAFAVKWAVQNYLRPGDAVILLHVRPTSIFYGADWGCTSTTHNIEQDYENLTNSKAASLALPLVEANVPFKIHIVKDRDMKERLCLEVERLGLSAMIMGSRGLGVNGKGIVKGKLGSVSDYCVHHCICPVVVVRYPQEDEKEEVVEADLPPVPEEDQEYHDADDDDLIRGE
ncbi:universal stress protein PHOS32-like [Lycium barbarum]|uniref:universal stress protein PHOS32-like n=1 Tax=Lycium barbarum TaxID=112863 RepID=UPI00293F0789|nr:universal stress protein PHOS32-like [Lycium barbarum]